ncbi:putative GTP-binding protein [Escherichia coli]|nr:putative GTP-binding protein [Escherichia coli]
MNPSDAIEAIEKPLSSLPYSLSRHILEHLRKLTSHEPVPGIMGKSGAGIRRQLPWPVRVNYSGRL